MLVLCTILVILGVIGSVVPLLPGVPLIFAGILIFAWSTGFTVVDGRFVIIAFALMIASAVLDWVAGSIGARRYGASPAGVTGALIGGIAGLFLMGPWGIIMGTFVGALAGEVLAGRSLDRALRVGWGSVVGLLAGTIARLVIALTLAIMFFVKVF